MKPISLLVYVYNFLCLKLISLLVLLFFSFGIVPVFAQQIEIETAIEERVESQELLATDDRSFLPDQDKEINGNITVKNVNNIETINENLAQIETNHQIIPDKIIEIEVVSEFTNQVTEDNSNITAENIDKIENNIETVDENIAQIETNRQVIPEQTIEIEVVSEFTNQVTENVDNSEIINQNISQTLVEPSQVLGLQKQETLIDTELQDLAKEYLELQTLELANLEIEFNSQDATKPINLPQSNHYFIAPELQDLAQEYLELQELQLANLEIIEFNSQDGDKLENVEQSTQILIDRELQDLAQEYLELQELQLANFQVDNNNNITQTKPQTNLIENEGIIMIPVEPFVAQTPINNQEISQVEPFIREELESDLSIESPSLEEEAIEQKQILVNAQQFLIPSTMEENRQPVVPGFIEPPQIQEADRINPAITRLNLNQFNLNHRTGGVITSNYTLGDNRSDHLNISALMPIDSQVEHSLLDNNVFRQEQTGEYVQLVPLLARREVNFTRVNPITALAMQLQMSFTGNCQGFGQAVPDESHCSYTPGIITDIEGSDPAAKLPKRFFQLGQVGDVISPRSREIMRQPGFQNIVENGQVVGLDFFFPNITGGEPGNTQSDITLVYRQEDFEYNTVPGVYRINQTLNNNSQQSVLNRTIRGTNFIFGDEDFGWNVALQGLAQLLPEISFMPQGSEEAASKIVNLNLLRAADLVRLPENSLTVYLAGAAQSNIPSEENPNQPANFNGLWIGLSPITTYNLEREIYGVATGPLVPIAGGGGEGGIDDNVDFHSQVNDFRVSTQELGDFYTQVYLTFYNRDVDVIFTSKLTEETNYFPHLSFTGSTADSNSILRYYTGIIPYSNTGTKAYLGADYLYSDNIWTLAGSVSGYLNPTRDYYSEISSSVNHKISFSSDKTLDLFTNFNYGLDQANNVGIFAVENLINTWNLGGKFNWDFGSIALQYNIDDVLPKSVESALILSGKVNVTPDISLSGFYTVESKRATTDLYGVNAQLQLNSGDIRTSLNTQWANRQFDYGDDPFGRPLNLRENVFSILLKMEGF